MNADLSTSYLGLKLRSPLIVSASPRSEYLRNIEEMAASGAGAIVFHSLFAEQMEEDMGTKLDLRIDQRLYCEHIEAAKQLVSVPIIASVNAEKPGDWIHQVRHLEDAGADALELNIYRVPAISDKSSAEIETEHAEMVSQVVNKLNIPVAVKITPYYTNLYQFSQRLAEVGAKGLVLFNRFIQSESTSGRNGGFSHLALSYPMETALPLHWMAALFGRFHGSLAATTGIQNAQDAAKMIMAGADVVELCSVLLRRGLTYLAEMECDLTNWMNEHGYREIDAFRGLKSFLREPDSGKNERVNYIRMLTHSEHRLSGTM